MINIRAQSTQKRFWYLDVHVENANEFMSLPSTMWGVERMVGPHTSFTCMAHTGRLTLLARIIQSINDGNNKDQKQSTKYKKIQMNKYTSNMRLPQIN